MSATRVSVVRRPMDEAAASALLDAAGEWIDELVEAGRLGPTWRDRVRPDRGDEDGWMSIVAWVGPVPAGVVDLRHRHGVGRVECLWVRPVARHRGVAHALLGAVLAHAADAGLDEVRLRCDPVEMADTRAVAARFGFVPVGGGDGDEMARPVAVPATTDAPR